MMKKMALCAVLILILVPAFAMAAGAQNQGSGTDQRSGLQNRQQATGETAVQEQIRTCLQQGDGTGQMIQNRTCDQEYYMLRNMTRSKVQQGPANGECQGSGFCSSTGTGESLTGEDGKQTSQSQDRMSGQKRIMSGLESGIGSGDKNRDHIRDSARNQTSLKDGSCGNCLNRSL